MDVASKGTPGQMISPLWLEICSKEVSFSLMFAPGYAMTSEQSWRMNSFECRELAFDDAVKADFQRQLE